MSELEIGLRHLGESDEVVEGGDGHVAAVEDTGPGEVGVQTGPRVEAAEGGLAGGSGADGAGAETGAFGGC